MGEEIVILSLIVDFLEELVSPVIIGLDEGLAGSGTEDDSDSCLVMTLVLCDRVGVTCSAVLEILPAGQDVVLERI